MCTERGLTAIELLATLLIISMMLVFALPAYANLVDKYELRTAVDAFISSARLARSEAVYRNRRVNLSNIGGSWELGWIVFEDSNSDGYWNDNELVLLKQRALMKHVRTNATTHARISLSYLPNGQSWTMSGAFQADSIYFCSSNKSLSGYRVVIAKGGRLRTEEFPANSPQCAG
jgi:type IV fimbrial biogenesis protein FimT